MRHAWLLCDGKVLAAAEIVDSYPERMKGLLGQDDYQGAMHFPRTRSVHTAFMRFPIDVAMLDRDLTVLTTIRLTRWRATLPRRRVHSVLEAKAGEFERWGLAVGDCLELREAR